MLLATVFPMKRVKGLVNLARAIRIYGDGGQEGRHVLSSQQQKRGNGLAKKFWIFLEEHRKNLPLKEWETEEGLARVALAARLWKSGMLIGIARPQLQGNVGHET